MDLNYKAKTCQEGREYAFFQRRFVNPVWYFKANSRAFCDSQRLGSLALGRWPLR